MRWIKLWRDIANEPGRTILMLAAIAIALFGVSAMLGAYGIVSREVPRNYLGTNPASATIDLTEVTPEALLVAASVPGVAEVEPRTVVEGRIRVEGGWMRALIFVVEDFTTMKMNRFTPVSGHWQPLPDAVLMEKLAADLVGVADGDRVEVRVGAHDPVSFPVAGRVHDTTLAPAWQEQTAYVYMTMASYAALGAPAVFDELRFRLEATPTQPEVDAKAREIADALKAAGIAVHEIKAPPVGMHPHQIQITTSLLMFLGLAILGLVLAAILVAAVLAASLARQSREVGVMKALGARSGQIAMMYVAWLLALGAGALVVGLPIGSFAAAGLAGLMADAMNFAIVDPMVPAWVIGVVMAGGIFVPLIVGLPAIIVASRRTVREALDEGGGARLPRPGAAMRRLPDVGPILRLAMRNAFRRRGRLLLNLSLLAVGGALFISALAAREGWRDLVGTILTDRHYDAEFRLSEPVPDEKLDAAIAGSGVVSDSEIWTIAAAAFSPGAGVEIMRTYPDKGHGSFALFGEPTDAHLSDLVLLAGRKLMPEDTDGIVLTQTALRLKPGLGIGDPVAVSVGDRPTTWTLIGVVREIGGGGAYVNRAALDAVAGNERQLMVRVAFDRARDGSTEAATDTLSTAFDDAGIGIERSTELGALYLALLGHVEVPVTMLVSAAILLAAIGGLGLASMTAINILERTREIGILKAIGATPFDVTRLIVSEAIVVAFASWVVSLLLSVPLALSIDQLGALMFGSPLVFSLPPAAVFGWLVLTLVIAIAASSASAVRAGRLVVRQALVTT